MTFAKLAQYFAKLEATPKRLEITSILAELINEADVSEVDKILYLTAGRLGPLFDNEDFNLGDKMLQRVLATAYNKTSEEIAKLLNNAGDLGDVAEKLASLTCPELVEGSVSLIYEKLTAIAFDSGSNSQDRKTQALASLLRSSDHTSAKYLVRIPLGKLRLGFSDVTVLDALSYTISGGKSLRTQIEATYNIYPDIGQIAKVLKESGTDGLKKIKLTPGVPILPERCSLVESSLEMLEKSDVWAVQPKYDGLRTQIHYGVTTKTSPITPISLIPLNQQSPIKTRIFSRGLEDITETMPEIVAAAEKLAADKNLQSFILDGEAVTVDPKTGKIMPFNDTVTRKRKYDIAAKSESNPLNIFVFDLLLLNGEDLTNEPYTNRYERLSKILLDQREASSKAGLPLHLTPQVILSESGAISQLFQKDIKAGFEGIVAKKPSSVYRAGARDYSWVKLKREGDTSGLADTIDCVVMGYYAGEGKRSNFGIGAFLVGVYDPVDDVFKTLAKIGTGLTDNRWRDLKAKCDQIKTAKMPTRYITPTTLIPHIWTDPKIVVSIRADQVTKSPSHSSGYSLRFPRLLDYREKLPEDANTVSDIEKLYKK